MTHSSMTHTDTTYDAVVVGAGPAGSSAAAAVARAGFQVLLLWCQGGGKIGCDAKGEWQSDLAESREPGEREVSWTRTERPQHRPPVMVGGTAGEGKSVIPVCTVLGSRTDP